VRAKAWALGEELSSPRVQKIIHGEEKKLSVKNYSPRAQKLTLGEGFFAESIFSTLGEEFF
jgi:hypothetical protein